VKYCIEHYGKLTQESFDQFCLNPMVASRNGGKQTKLFDLVENMNPSECAKALSNIDIIALTQLNK